jgi:hypothetical protein
MLSLAKNTNLLVMFLLELGVLASAALWGFTAGSGWPVKLLLGLGAPALFVAVWALFGAANGATFPLHGLARVALELVWFGGAAALLAATGRVTLAAVFAAVYLANAALRLFWHQ